MVEVIARRLLFNRFVVHKNRWDEGQKLCLDIQMLKHVVCFSTRYVRNKAEHRAREKR